MHYWKQCGKYKLYGKKKKDWLQPRTFSTWPKGEKKNVKCEGSFDGVTGRAGVAMDSLSHRPQIKEANSEYQGSGGK